MKTSDEFWDATDANDGGRRGGPVSLPAMRRGLVGTPPGEAPNAAAAAINSRILLDIIDAILMRSDSARGGVIYFPPGRYYLGRPAAPPGQAPAGGSDVVPPGLGPGLFHIVADYQSDVVVPENVTLLFAPGATLVPFNYFNDRAAPRASIPVDGRPEEDLLVRLEIRGSIRAGVHPIFDAVFENPGPIGMNLELPAPGGLHQAGIVLFTRNEIREVYPEWWGAVVPEQFAGLPDERLPLAVVRRMTMALQECVRAAHTRRSYAPGYPMGPIPIALSGRYVIDREVQVGMRWQDAVLIRPHPNPMVTGPDPGSFDARHPLNLEGIVIRGVAGPGADGCGLATIVAHSSFHENGDMDDNANVRQPRHLEGGVPRPRNPPESAALLAIRGGIGSVLQNFTLDAAGRASRCLTFQSIAAAAQMTGIDGCAFRGARRTLLHIGGEFAHPKAPRAGDDKRTHDGTFHFTGGQDLLGLRVSRCVFDTGEAPRRGAVLVGNPPVGVMAHASNTLGTEFFACDFRGFAAPMIRCSTDGVLLHRCTFDTRRQLGHTTTEHHLVTTLQGVDVYLDFPPYERHANAMGAIPVAITTCAMKDVVSRSPVLLSTFRSRNPAISGGIGVVRLSGVTHRPRVVADEPIAPAIIWAGMATTPGRLILSGCSFERPVPAFWVPFRFEAPVMIDMFPTANDATEFQRDVMQWRTGSGSGSTGFGEVSSSRGHVVDLGNRLVGARDLVGLSSAMRARGLDLIRDLQIFERWSELMVRP